MTKAKLYKGRYLIALYDHEDEWCVGVYENATEMVSDGGKSANYWCTAIKHYMDRQRNGARGLGMAFAGERCHIHLIEADDGEERKAICA